MFLSEWCEFPLVPCLAGKKNLMTACILMLKLRATLTCFRACSLPGRAKDLSAPLVFSISRKKRELVEDDERGDHPKLTRTEVNIAAIADLVKNDCVKSHQE